jgi:gluconolactonase
MRERRQDGENIRGTKMPLQRIPTSAWTKIARGIDRPEDVVVGRDGRVFASDHQCAVAEIFPDGSFKRMGPKGGAPNGVNMDARGRIIIANFGVYDGEPGPLQLYDPNTDHHETLLREVGGRMLTSANYPVIDSVGNIWCANSTDAPTWPDALDGRPDGFVFVYRPNGSAEIVASGLKFPNGCALSADETRLYVNQTTGGDVLEFPILPGEKLGPGRRYGPKLGFVANRKLNPKLHLPSWIAGRLGYTDGNGFDVDGNLWVTLPATNKIVAIRPNGTVFTVAHDPSGAVMNHPTNVTWGGADMCDLYVGSIRADYVLKTRSPVAGQKMVHQR